MRFGCCIGADGIGLVQDAGYDYVELPVKTVRPESPDSEFEPIRDGIQSLDIVAEVWNQILPSDLKITGPEVDSYRLERYLRTAFERIGELGGEVVGFGAGPSRRVPEGYPAEKAVDQIVDALTLAGQIAGTHGLIVGVEGLHSGQCNLINSTLDALEIVRRVDHPFVKLLADIYHMQKENEPVGDIVEVMSELVHVHVADADRGCPGNSDVPYRELFETLRSIGYNDRISVECDWRDPKTECPRAIEFLRRLDDETPY